MNDLFKKIAKINDILLNESDLSSALNLLLKELGSASTVDRAYVFKNKIVDGDLRMFYSYEWCNANIKSFIKDPSASNFSYKDFRGMLETFLDHTHILGLTKDANNQLLKAVLEIQEIKSYLFVPIYSQNILWGWMGYDNCSTEYKWREEEVEILV